MAKQNNKTRTIYDIPVTFYCRDCKNPIEKSLAEVERHPLTLTCRACPQEFAATEDEIAEARDRHRKRFDAILKALGR